MQFKLIISSNSETNTEPITDKERVFQNGRVIHIGRGHPNEVPLIDPLRKISRIQARILSIRDEHILEDLNSKNYTYLNDSPLKPGQKVLLQYGDRISVGDYSLEYIPIFPNGDHSYTNPMPQAQLENGVTATTVLPKEDTTPYKPSVESNPFTEFAESTAKSIEALCYLYDTESSETRSAQLSEALRVAFTQHKSHTVFDQLGSTLTDLHLHTDTIEAPSSPPTPEPRVLEDRATLVVGTLILILQRIASIPYSFKKSFAGKREITDPYVKYLLSNDASDLADFVLRSDYDESEVKKRLSYFEMIVSSIERHQKGMLAGYKNVTHQTLDMVLAELDPEQVEKSPLDSQAKKKRFTVSRTHSTLEAIKQKTEELRKIDWRTYEQRVYRPVFTKGYLSIVDKKE